MLDKHSFRSYRCEFPSRAEIQQNQNKLTNVFISRISSNQPIWIRTKCVWKMSSMIPTTNRVIQSASQVIHFHFAQMISVFIPHIMPFSIFPGTIKFLSLEIWISGSVPLITFFHSLARSLALFYLILFYCHYRSKMKIYIGNWMSVNRCDFFGARSLNPSNRQLFLILDWKMRTHIRV